MAADVARISSFSVPVGGRRVQFGVAFLSLEGSGGVSRQRLCWGDDERMLSQTHAEGRKQAETWRNHQVAETRGAAAMGTTSPATSSRMGGGQWAETVAGFGFVSGPRASNSSPGPRLRLGQGAIAPAALPLPGLPAAASMAILLSGVDTGGARVVVLRRV